MRLSCRTIAVARRPTATNFRKPKGAKRLNGVVKVVIVGETSLITVDVVAISSHELAASTP